MGLITEQLSLPHVVSHTYAKPTDCDELHAFESVPGKKIGLMNTKVKEVLDLFNQQGLKVWVSDVRVNIGETEISYAVTITESNDGEFWGGFTSRGAGCNNNIKNRWNNESVGNGPNAIRANIVSDKDKLGRDKTPVCKSVKQLELVKKIEYTNLGDNSFIQGFYRYKCGEHNLVQNTQTNPIQTTPKKVNQSTQNTKVADEKFITIKSDGLAGLREKLSQETQNISIDPKSIVVDINNYSVSFKKGNTQIKKISLIYDDQGKLNDRLSNLLLKNPTMDVKDAGNITINAGGTPTSFQWIVSIIT